LEPSINQFLIYLPSKYQQDQINGTYTYSGEKVIDIASPTRIYTMGRTETWNVQNEEGLPVSSGVYYYVIQKDAKVLNRGKILVVISQKN
jgi:hypothetical protein